MKGHGQEGEREMVYRQEGERGLGGEGGGAGPSQGVAKPGKALATFFRGPAQVQSLPQEHIICASLLHIAHAKGETSSDVCQVLCARQGNHRMALWVWKTLCCPVLLPYEATR
jgi:hypothetical protein